MLYGQIKADLALTGGVHSAADVVKSMMAGARVAMMTSALLEDGPQYLDVVTKTWNAGWTSTNTNPSSRCRAA